MPNLGWVNPNDRTQEQMDAHEKAIKAMPKFAIAGGVKTLAKGEKVVLYDFLDKPEVVADIGFVFPWFHQLTGSCVGASSGNIIACLSAVQRCVGDAPTKAFVPFWPYNYGMGRADEGDRGQGEGAINSVAVERMKKGILPASEAKDLPQFSNNDGLQLTESLEMKWSNGNSSLVQAYEGTAAKFPVGTAAEVNDPDTMETGIINGYPAYGGCSEYVGNGSLKGSGANACVMGRFDGNGGHSTGFYGVWNHPDFGRLFLYGNNWPGSTYPRDPSINTPRCTVWIPESEVAKIPARLDGRGEYFLISHATYFPAQPSVLDWVM